jgi:hypothetical protein
VTQQVGPQMRNNEIQMGEWFAYLNITVFDSLFRTSMHRTYTLMYSLGNFSLLSCFFLTLMNIKPVFVFSISSQNIMLSRVQSVLLFQ